MNKTIRNVANVQPYPSSGDKKRGEYSYKFSVITAVYNTANVLRETIESLLGQDIGFLENVQLILVNDGSTDGSGDICDEYALLYPYNIFVIHKENGGAASARNAGLAAASGKYLNFLDSDDKFSRDVLSKVYAFFEEHYGETDVVTVPVHFFDAFSSPHWLNWKFNGGTRVIDLRQEYQAPCIFTTASFFKIERRGEMEFDPRLATGEDAKFIFAQLYPKLTLGVVSDVKHLYRRQHGGSSLVQSSRTKKTWYLSFVPHLIHWAYDFYMQRLGKLPAFVQYTLLCDYQWRILEPGDPSSVLTAGEIEEYKRQLYGALQLFDHRNIMELRRLSRRHKIFMVVKKYGTTLREEWTDDDLLLFAGGEVLFRESDNVCKIDFLDLMDGVLNIEGSVELFSRENVETTRIILKIGDKFHLCEKTNKDRSTYFLGDVLLPSVSFQLSLPVEDNSKIEIYVEINGRRMAKKNVRFSQFCPLTHTLANSYYCDSGRALSYSQGVFSVAPCGGTDRFFRELRLLAELCRVKERAAKRAVLRRVLHHLAAPFQRKERWIISDRIDKAGDNGEALFRYMCQQKEPGIDCCFAIARNSPDYKRLKKTGKVIPLRGQLYKFYCLQGARIISSHAEQSAMLPFFDDTRYYADLFHKSRFVFLQHGIILHDISDYLNRYNKNIALFATATMPEYRSILQYDYHYTEEQVKLTGIPRYDLLVRDEKRCVTIMPTWRKYLLTRRNIKTGKWDSAKGFQQSRFFRFYYGLLNDQKLLRRAAELGYALRFMLHPVFQPFSDMLRLNEQVELLSDTTPYRQIFAESDLLVTDYSSVAFDFAYLRKPLIYCQFDADEFFSGKHSYSKGYFDYGRDGFGEVACDLDTTVQYIVEYMESGCKLKEKYRSRIDSTFAFNDRNNCQRVRDAIKALS